MSLDLYNLADKSQLQQVFYASGNWVKPRGVNMVEILCVGAGGGGGRGVSKPTGSAGGGGGGGGSGSSTTIMIPAMLLPETLDIYVGIGGRGATSASTSSAGQNTYVTLPSFIRPQPTSYSGTPLVCQAYGGNGGGNGAINTAGAAGTSPLASSVGTYSYYLLGLNRNTAGQSGAAGGTTAGGGSITIGTNGVLFSGGAGGGGSSTADSVGGGGSITSGSGILPTIAVSNTASENGKNGNLFFKPLAGYGGTGGAAGPTGGRGGNGAPGAGGGGGSTGYLSGTQGDGGNGGNGLVIINCW